jgi:hypothetical protein
MVVAFTSSLSTASSVSGANVGDASGRSSVSSSTVARFASSLPLVSSVADSKVGSSGNEETEDVVTAEAVYSRIGQYDKSKRKRKKVHIQLHQVIVFEFPWVKKRSCFFEGDNRENT